MSIAMFFYEKVETSAPKMCVLTTGKFNVKKKITQALKCHHHPGKTKWMHWETFLFLTRKADCETNSLDARCDFEKLLMNATRNKFPSAHAAGCLFHFTEA